MKNEDVKKEDIGIQTVRTIDNDLVEVLIG